MLRRSLAVTRRGTSGPLSPLSQLRRHILSGYPIISRTSASRSLTTCCSRLSQPFLGRADRTTIDALPILFSSTDPSTNLRPSSSSTSSSSTTSAIPAAAGTDASRPSGIAAPPGATAPKTRAIIFDLGGVLVPSPFKIFKQFARDNQLPEGLLKQAIYLSSASPDGAFSRLDCGAIGVNDFAGPFGAEVSSLLGRSVSAQKLVDDLKAATEEQCLEPFHEMIETIAELKSRGFLTALLTNNWKKSNGDSLQPINSGLFDVVVESCKEGVRKPDPRIFQLCLERLSLSPEACVFLDDLGINLRAANSLGIRTIKVEPSNLSKSIRKLWTFLGFPRGTAEVPQHLEINVENLRTYLNQLFQTNVPDLPRLRIFTHGQSNPTYHVVFGDSQFVLRKKPPGKLLPSAHLIEREYKIINAAKKQGVPVPKCHGFCSDASVIGTPFYLMDFVAGRIFKDVTLTELNEETVDVAAAVRTTNAYNRKSAVYLAMSNVLAAIHRLDFDVEELRDYGKTDGAYLKRNLARWAGQAEKSSSIVPLPGSLTLLHSWLESNIPTEETISVVHGDFRLDNLIFNEDSAEVLAVLDWELSTIGDPLTDVATSALPYYLPSDAPHIAGFPSNFPFASSPSSHGVPSLDAYLSSYAAASGRPLSSILENWTFHVGFVLFRLAAIVHGVYARALAGQNSSPKALAMGPFAEQLADLGLNVVTGKTNSRNNAETPRKIDGENVAKVSASSKDPSPPPPIVIHATPHSLPPLARKMHARVREFISELVLPRENEYFAHATHEATRWQPWPGMEALKAEARKEGLWNLFIPLEADPDCKYGAGLTNAEYAHIAEETGKSLMAPEVFNCSAPDTGNMEVLIKYGSAAQRQRWLKPLLDGDVRSCFAMTEPGVASSDATNIASTIARDGADYVINGSKWWISGAMDPRCKICIFMGKTDPSAAKHAQQSMILVPMDSPGLEIVRPLTVFGYDDSPVGHAELRFSDVRVPVENILLGEGRGFEIAQGRLGPGRIHHCMRLIGHAERAMELMLSRSSSRVAFGKRLSDQGTVQRDIAQNRIDIEQTRLLVLKAASMMDAVGNKKSAKEIAMIKVVAPSMAARVIDRTMQVFGGGGLSGDFPLAAMFAWARVLRLADGPDAVHIASVAKMEMRKK